MAQTNTLDFDNKFDLEQILVEAQHRWLRTHEICDILRNHDRFDIAPEPPNMPPSGSLFLFDRKVLRYFRKDGHSWRKKKDGKTVKEAHEKLKAGSIDVLHCYYAHGEHNENFQRRSYWMLEDKLSHIVLVHYREVKGYRTNFNRLKETEEAITSAPEGQQIVHNSEAENFVNSGFQQNSFQLLHSNTGDRSLDGAQVPNDEDAESGSYQTKSTTISSLEFDEDSSSQKHKKELDLWKWEDALDSPNVRVQDALASKDLGLKNRQYLQVDDEGMFSGSPCKLKDAFMPKLHDYLVVDSMCMDDHTMDTVNHLQNQLSVSAYLEDQSDVESSLTVGEKASNFSAARNIFDRPVKDEVLKKSDSFSQWICKELGDMEPVMLSSGSSWASDVKRSGCPNLSFQAEFNSYALGPSISQEQFFRIIDFAPTWGYAGSETKVLITGKFLKTKPDAGKYQLSCRFGEMEVPAEIIADGVIRCYAPPLNVARVHFYVTCSNRLACSEVKEFEYRDKCIHGFDMTSLSNKCDALQIRLCKLLSLGSRSRQNILHCNSDASSGSHAEFTSSGIGTEWFQILELTSKEDCSLDELKDRLTKKFMKEMLCEWLLCKEVDGGNGLRVLDENGQGVLHLAAALGFDWAISPTVAAGVSINFRDVRGWTALHWAAFYGRERTVAYLISMGASAGALTDPTPTYPLGKTSADLASENGHKGIAGFLAESALTAHLESLTLMNENKQDCAIGPHGMTSVFTTSERMATAVSVSGDNLDGLSLKDSLAALCNATQAAAQIHQVYRLHSFKRKQMKECGTDKIEKLDEYALSLSALKSHKQAHQNDEPVHAAAIRIQNKYRSWKGRKDFVALKQKIVKIQAHFRGHQIRKHYKAIVWSVGIVEKVILRWRRKQSGLRGFKSESLTLKSQSEGASSNGDDYDFLKKGRKQAEERLQKALSRVKSMFHCPEARDQYRRLLTTVGEIKELKDGCSGAIDGSNASASMDDDLVDIDTLLNGKSVP